MRSFHSGVVMSLRTPLHSSHTRMGAKLVGFGGWRMPLHYGSQMAEHHHVRRHCAMFDVSHMAVVDIAGAQADAFLQRVLANDIAKLGGARQALYSVMLNPRGGVVDDLMVYALPTGFRLVINCATTGKDLAWLGDHAPAFEVAIRHRSDLAIIAVQGPAAIAKVLAILPTETANAVASIPRFGAVLAGEQHIARTGYTGEDGLEIILPDNQAEQFWWRLHDAGVPPAGLGARDTLRLEAGLNLYGHEMDESVSPLHANLGWTIAWQPRTRNFVGREALSKARAVGVKNKLVGVLMTEKGVLRAQQALYLTDTDRVGVLTSGSFSPTLGYAIGLARVPVDAGATGQVSIRGKRKAVQLLSPGFVRNGKVLIAVPAV